MPAQRQARDVWAVGAAYDAYIGRWSALVARELLAWLAVPAGCRWLDVGCGSGTLVEAILEDARPSAVIGVDRSRGFVAHARARADDVRAAFAVGDAQALPLAGAAFDAVVSGLVLNFVAEPARMAAELARVASGGAAIGVYVWDYAGRMELLRVFWDAAKALDAGAAALDEATRFPICAPEPLEALLRAAGLDEVASRAIEVVTRFRDFDDCWSPFLGGQGPAPSYVASLPPERRTALREAIRARLPVERDGAIALTARAWAVRGWKTGA